MNTGFVKNYQKVLIILFLIIFAISVRMIFRTGVLMIENFENRAISKEIAISLSNFRGHHQSSILFREISTFFATYGARQTLYCFPFAILFSFFGPHELIVLLSQVMFIIATSLLLFRIGKFFGGELTGFIVIFIWAFLPVDIYLSTSFSKNAATFFFQLLFFLLFIEAIHKPKINILKLILSLFSFLLSFALDLSSVVFFIGGFFYFLYVKLNIDHKKLIPLLFITWLVLGFYLAKMLEIGPNFGLRVLNGEIFLNDRNIIVLFVLLVFSSTQIITTNKKLKHVISIVIFFFFYTFFALFFNHNFNNFINISNIALPIYFSAALVISVYLGEKIQEQEFIKTIPWILLLVLVISVWIARSNYTLISSTSSTFDYPWILDNPLLIVFEIIPGLTLVLFLLNILVNKFIRVDLFPSGTKHILLLILLTFSQYNVILSQYIPSFSVRENTKSIISYLETKKKNFPVFVDDNVIYLALTSHLDNGGLSTANYSMNLIQDDELDLNNPKQENAYYLLNNVYEGSFPKNWFLEKVFDGSGTQPIYLYRYIQKEDLDSFLDLSHQSDDKEYWNYGELINKEMYCDGYAAWIQYAGNFVNDIPIIPVFEEDCDEFIIRGHNLINNEEWETIWGSGGLSFSDDQIVFSKRYYFRNDTYFQDIAIEANTFYLLSYDIKIPERIITPYFVINDELETYLFSSQSFPDWTHLAFLIKTPELLNTESLQMRLFPYLTYGNFLRTTTSQVKNIYLYEIMNTINQ